MAKLSAITTPSLTFDEGAAPSTPASGDVILYAKTDGLLYSKDDAGTETLVSGGVGGGGGVDAGTSFPVGPASGDLYFRTDRGLLYYYDGTRWLTVNEYQLPIMNQEQLAGATSSPQWLYGEIDNGTYDFYCTHVACSTNVLTTNNGSNYYSVTISRNPSNTSLGSFTTASDTAGTNTRHDVTVNALLGTSDRFMQITATKTNSPGALYVQAVAFGRKVG